MTAVRFVLCSFFFLLTTTLATAQGRTVDNSVAFLLISDAVVKELKLNAKQQERIKSLLADYVVEIDGQLRIAISGAIDLDALDDDAIKILDKKQGKRLYEALLKSNGTLALSHPKVAKELAISKDQSKKIEDVVADMRIAFREVMLEHQGDQQRMRTEVKRLSLEAAASIEKVLTAEQKTRFVALQGEKIPGLEKKNEKDTSAPRKK